MIKLNNISKKYNKSSVALNDVTLHIEPGEFVSVIGQSGSGKTTLVKLIIAEENASHGAIEVGGWDITRLREKHVPYYRRQIGVIFQDFKLLHKKTVFENVAFALQVAGEKPHRISAVVPKVLDIVGLKEKSGSYPTELSGGEQQRVVIARSLVHRPKILVADEPTGNLDTINTQEIMEILKRINSFGTTVLLVTHNREIVNQLKRRVITIDNGEIVSDKKVGKYKI
jgi:cell division transport system ATP-binding protein